MTHSGGKPHNVGDKGQRYEVTFRENDGEGARKVFGWSNDIAGANSMVSCIDAHPTWCSPRVKDRHAAS